MNAAIGFVRAVQTTLFLALCLTCIGCGAQKVSKAKYDQIKEGMSYAEVKKIIGSEGEEMASSKTEGIPGAMPGISTKMYMWQNADGSNMNAMFQNDKLVNKAQAGLK